MYNVSNLDESMAKNPIYIFWMSQKEYVCLVKKDLKSMSRMVNGGYWVLSLGVTLFVML